MKAFVTGSTGLLGNNLVRALEAQGATVVGLARSADKARRLLGDTSARVVAGDMERIDAFASELDGCDVVFHTAAYFREYYGPGDHAAALRRINVEATLALMAEADRRGVRRFVHVGSSGSIGMHPDGRPGDEQTPPGPAQLENLYFRSKHEGDRAIQAFSPAHGMAVIEILPGWMFGPGDAGPTGAGQLTLDVIGRKIPVTMAGGMCVVDARDVAAAMVTAAGRGRHGDRFIVGGEFRTMADVIGTLAAAGGVPGPSFTMPVPVALAAAHVSELVAKVTGKPALLPLDGVRTAVKGQKVSSARAVQELGASFRPFAETARDVVAWYRQHPA